MAKPKRLLKLLQGSEAEAAVPLLLAARDARLAAEEAASATVRAHLRCLSGFSVSHSESLSMVLLYGRAGRLTYRNDDFRPG